MISNIKIFLTFLLFIKNSDEDIQIFEKHINVPLDHYNASDNRQFKLRYLISDDAWNSPDSPIIFYTGNEGDIYLFKSNCQYLENLVSTYQGLLVFAEHRYYGTSLPFGPKKTFLIQNMKYLTSEQALLDFAYLIKYLLSDRSDAPHRPIIAVGGSYGGMLATWIRQKFPHYITGSIAASAPLNMFYQKVSCETFYYITSSVYKNVSIHCFDAIQKSWVIIDSLFKNTSNLPLINDIFNVCNDAPLLVNESSYLKDWISDILVSVAMANYPYPANFLGEMPAWPVKEVCKRLEVVNTTDSDVLHLKRLYNAISVSFNYTGQATCNNINGRSSPLFATQKFGIPTSKFLISRDILRNPEKIKQLHHAINNDLSYSANQDSPSLGYLAWAYQSCTEMVNPICSPLNLTGNMFEHSVWNFTAYAQSCRELFNVTPTPDWLATQYNKPIKAQKFYDKSISSALTPIDSYSRIIFTNGLLDPWSGGGVYKEQPSRDIWSLVMPEGAHHLDLRAPNISSDPESVKNTRLLESLYIYKWLCPVKIELYRQNIKSRKDKYFCSIFYETLI